MTRRSFYASSVAVLVTASCLCLYLFHRGFVAVSWDESGRTLDAYSWFAHGVPDVPVWLPFYRVCVGSALKFYPDLFLTPRFVTCLFGLVAALGGAWLTHELFLNRNTTLLALTLNAFLSQRIALSLAPLSEIMFVAAILVAMAAFAKWLRTGSLTALWVCAAAATTASTIRYEGWIFNAAFFLAGLVHYLRAQTIGRKQFFVWALVLFAYPAVRTVAQFASVNDFYHMVANQRRYTAREILERNPLFEFISANAAILNLVGLAGVFQVARRGEWRQKAVLTASFCPLACASLALLIVGAAQTSAPWRMSCVWTMLLIPITARFLTGQEWTFRVGRIAPALQLCAAALLLAASLADTVRMQKEASSWAFPQSDRLAGKYLDGVIRKAPETRILIESSLFFYLTVLVASQHPDSFVENSVPEQPDPPLLAPGASVRSVAEARKIRLFVFRTEEYKRFFDSSPEVVKLEEFGPWAVYRAVP
jgi:hypothetical protein